MVPAASAATLATLATASATPPDAFEEAFEAASLAVELPLLAAVSAASAAVLAADLYLIDSGLGTPRMPRSSVSKTNDCCQWRRMNWNCVQHTEGRASRDGAHSTLTVALLRGDGQSTAIHVSSRNGNYAKQQNCLTASRQCTTKPMLAIILELLEGIVKTYHIEKTLVPAGNHLAGAQVELERYAAVVT